MALFGLCINDLTIVICLLFVCSFFVSRFKCIFQVESRFWTVALQCTEAHLIHKPKSDNTSETSVAISKICCWIFIVRSRRKLLFIWLIYTRREFGVCLLEDRMSATKFHRLTKWDVFRRETNQNMPLNIQANQRVCSDW